MKILAAVGFLLSVAMLASPAAADSAGLEPRVIVVGDSIAWGYAPNIKSQRPVINASIPGSCLFVRECANREAPRYMDRLRAADIRSGDTVVISIGHNDLDPGRARDYRRAYRQAVRYITARGGQPLVATITPFGGKLEWNRPTMDARRLKVNQWILKHTPSFDLAATLGHGIHMPDRYNCGDGLHPNAAGARSLGAAMSAALRR